MTLVSNVYLTATALVGNVSGVATLIDAVAGFLPQGTLPGRPISRLQVRCSWAILPGHVDLESP